MVGASRRFRTVRATIRHWYDEARGHRALATDPSYRDALGSRETPEGERERIARIWFERPDRMRIEREGSGLTVVRGGRWWVADEDGVESNEDDPRVGLGDADESAHLLDPSMLLGALELDPTGELTVAGRTAKRLRAVPRGGLRNRFDLHRLGIGADEYELVVDAERGILLRTTAFLDGEPFASAEFVEIAFDEPFPSQVFDPPRGEPRDRPWSRRESITLEEAARAAPFSVLVPQPLAGEWMLEAAYYEEDEAAAVTLEYSLPDATYSFRIEEHPVDSKADFWDAEDWREVTREGERIRVVDEPQRRPRLVRVEREATVATLSSDSLPLDDLLELASRLQAVA